MSTATARSGKGWLLWEDEYFERVGESLGLYRAGNSLGNTSEQVTTGASE